MPRPTDTTWPEPRRAAKCDVIVANNNDILLIADDAEGFGDGVKLQISPAGIVTAFRNRKCIVVGRIPEPIAGYARRRGEVLFRCLATGTTRLLTYPSPDRPA